jgi:hypothetical protein
MREAQFDAAYWLKQTPQQDCGRYTHLKVRIVENVNCHAIFQVCLRDERERSMSSQGMRPAVCPRELAHLKAVLCTQRRQPEERHTAQAQFKREPSTDSSSTVALVRFFRCVSCVSFEDCDQNDTIPVRVCGHHVVIFTPTNSRNTT